MNNPVGQAATSAQLERAKRHLRAANRKWPERMVDVPEAEWPDEFHCATKRPIMVFRSRRFVAQVFEEQDHILRLSVVRTDVVREQGVVRFRADISWEELQQVKHECGFGGYDAVEVYPRNVDVVNVANMRHLWIVPPLPFAWRAK